MPAEVYVRAFYKKYALFLGLAPGEIGARYQQQDRNVKKTGRITDFNPVITLKGQEENPFAEILRRLLLPIIIISSGFLIYWFYKNYLSSYNLLGFFQERFPSLFSHFTRISADFFS